MWVRLPSIVLACASLAACTLLPRIDRQRQAPTTARRTPIARALDFVVQTQWREDNVANGDRAWVGNWPQTVELLGTGARITEVSPGHPGYIHLSLRHVHEGTAAAVGLRASDVRRARAARRRAARFIRKFEEPPGPLAGAFGWWPRATCDTPGPNPLGDALIAHLGGGPAQCGTLAPVGLRWFPKSLRIWPDADDTAFLHAALQTDAELDGGPPPPQGMARVLAAWRDDGMRRRGFPPWLPRGSGAFVTWFALPQCAPAPNDVDLPVLANVVWALARANARDTPGFAESVRVLRDAVRDGRHRRPRETTHFYMPIFSLHYLVSRACVDGPIPELQETTQRLADDIEARPCARTRTPASDAACALATLVRAGRRGPTLARLARRLIAHQDPRTGAFPDEPTVYGRTNAGQTIVWRCQAAVTATALEALVLWRSTR